MNRTVLLYEYMDGQPYPGIVVSPAPASSVHEPTIPGVEELGFQQGEGLGWVRTVLLAIGAGLGVLTVATWLHGFKQGYPGKEPKGWARTAVLAVGAGGGTLAAAGMIHLARRKPGEALRFDLVEEV